MADVDMRGWVLATVILAVAPAWAGESDLERRVRILEQRLSSRALMEMMQQVDQLQREVQSLRGQVEALENTLAKLRKSQKQQYLDLDGRLRRLEGGEAVPEEGSAAPVEAQPPSASQSVPSEQSTAMAQQKSGILAPVKPNVVLVPPSEEQKKAYRQAYDKLQAGHFEAAIEAFTTFLQQTPQTTLSANAYYWLGEAYYVKRDFNAAQASFRQVVERFPSSSKVPDALLKLGYVAYEQGHWQDARSYLDQVIQRFPDTHASRLAAERLERMRREGRV